MDNLPAHKVQGVVEAITLVGARTHDALHEAIRDGLLIT